MVSTCEVHFCCKSKVKSPVSQAPKPQRFTGKPGLSMELSQRLQLTCMNYCMICSLFMLIAWKLESWSLGFHAKPQGCISLTAKVCLWHDMASFVESKKQPQSDIRNIIPRLSRETLYCLYPNQQSPQPQQHDVYNRPYRITHIPTILILTVLPQNFGRNPGTLQQRSLGVFGENAQVRIDDQSSATIASVGRLKIDGNDGIGYHLGPICWKISSTSQVPHTSQIQHKHCIG